MYKLGINFKIINLKNNITFHFVTCFLVVNNLFFGSLNAQDIQFSQFYTVVGYQNPAFAGSVHALRGIAHQRFQWLGLSSKYTTSYFGVDGYKSKYSSGFGLYLMRDWQGASTITSNEAQVQYSYEIKLNSGFTIRPGLQLGYVSRNVNYADFRFSQDFDDYGFNGNTYNQYGAQVKNYADISSGIVAYSDKLWVGFSAHHMNMPNQSFYNQISRLPVKFALTGGYKILIEHSSTDKYMASASNAKEVSVTPTFHYKSQGKSDQFDLGLYGIYDHAILGMWYRGIPIKKYRQTLQNNESFVALAGWKYEGLSIRYSYDFTLSKLAPARTGGSHEISITYIHRNVKKNKPMRKIPCPSFYRD